MKMPFIYGKLASGNSFTNRQKEIDLLKRNFRSGVNTILLSPRRWGKSSLVKKAGEEMITEDTETKVVFIDMFNLRTEGEFYKVLSEKIFATMTSRMEDLFSSTKEFLKQWIPQITFSPGAQQEFSFGLNWQEVRKNPDEILDLPEAVAVKKNVRIIVCIDEFQNISYFEDALAFQKKLRSHWQQHEHVTYCPYGSKRHMLMQVFASPSMPLYKFGDLIFLQKISNQHWQQYISERFHSTGKYASHDLASRIAALMENHPYYVQQLAQLCWFRTNKKLTENIIDQALESLVLQLAMLFQNITSMLSNTQVNFLKAIIDGVEMMSSKQTIESYSLGTSANVARIKEALINKEIIDDHAGKITILDPVYTIWLRDFYF